MEETRASIRDTVDDLRGRVNSVVNWRHYVNRRPGASLTVAAALGMLLGRLLGGLVMRKGRVEEAGPYDYAGYAGADVHGESRLTTAASRAADSAQSAARSAYEAAGPALVGARRAMGQSVSRLGSRAEGILNRLIDELTDAVETTLVPALIARFRGLIDFEGRGSQRREGGYGTRSGFVGESRREHAASDAGGPSGPQHYPTQGRTASQA